MKTVETVQDFGAQLGTGLKPGVNETTSYCRLLQVESTLYQNLELRAETPRTMLTRKFIARHL